jgi:hypothetical protein
MAGETANPLQPGETGGYADLAGRPLPAGLVLVFIPSLAALFTRAEQLKGSSLTRAEVVSIRDRCTAVALTAQAARALEERRGYADLDPRQPWEGWLRLNKPRG